MDVERDLREHIEAAIAEAAKEESDREEREARETSRSLPAGKKTPPPSPSGATHRAVPASGASSVTQRSVPASGFSNPRMTIPPKSTTPPPKGATPVPKVATPQPSLTRSRPPSESSSGSGAWATAAPSLSTPPGSIRALKSPKRTDAPSSRSPAKLELIEYGPDDQLIDHKGRSKPMYKPRSPRPENWRPSRPVRLLLGLVPGVRVMALSSARDGAPYAALGLLSLVAGLFLLAGWPSLATTVDALQIDPRWTLAHAAAIVVLFAIYETLRLTSCFEERRPGLRAPRILATLFIPSLITLMLGPMLMTIWPRLVEASWFAALVVAFGATTGMIWTAFEGTLNDARERRTFRIAGGSLVIALLVAGIATEAFSSSSLRLVASAARSQGFRALPQIIALFA